MTRFLLHLRALQPTPLGSPNLPNHFQMRKSHAFCLYLLCVFVFALTQMASAAFTFTPGHTYTTVTYSRTITEHNLAGAVTGSLTIPPELGSEVRGVAFGPDDLLYAVVVRGTGFAVLALDSSGGVQATYTKNSSLAGQISNGRIAVAEEHFYVADSGTLTKFEIGNMGPGTVIYVNNQVFDAKILPNGNLLVASAYELKEITPSGTLVRDITLQGAGLGRSFVDMRAVEYDAVSNKIFVTQHGSSNFEFDILRLDATTGVLEKSVLFSTASDLCLKTDGNLIVGNRWEIPRIYNKDLEVIGTVGTQAQMVVTQFAPPVRPSGGTFTLHPASPVKSGTLITATFAGWSGAPGPFAYSVREGYSVLVSPGASESSTFTLPVGTHFIHGRIRSTSGAYSSTAVATVIVDDTAPSISTPASGFAPLVLRAGSSLPNYASQTSVTDAHGVASVVQIPAAGSIVPQLLLDGITITATDVAGNSSTYQFSVVVDGTAPSITPPTGGFFPLTVIRGSALPNYASQAIVADAHGVASVVQSPAAGSIVPDVLPDGIAITATDPVGNSSTYRIYITLDVAGFSLAAPYSTGTIVAGGGIDPRIPAAAVWAGFGSPAINDAGQVAYLGKWRGTQSGIGVFVDDTLIVKAGESVPGIAGAVFKSFKDPVIDSAGHVAFIAIISGAGVTTSSDTVVVTTATGSLGGNLAVLAREGSPATETGGATFKEFQSVSIQDGCTLFVASLLRNSGSPLVASRNDLGAWWLPAGSASIIKVMREDDALGTETIKAFQLLKSLSVSPGHGRGHSGGNEALLQLTLTGGPATREVHVLAQPGTLTEVTGAGKPLGGTNPATVTWRRLGMPSPASHGARVSVAGTLSGVPSSIAKGVFLSIDAGTSWDSVALTGSPAPGFGSGITFRGFNDPVTSDSGLAFHGSLTGTPIVSANRDGIWWQPEASPLLHVAQEGFQAPGAPAGAVWKAFSSLGLPGGATGPIFTATLHSGGITSANDFALYAVDSAGTVRPLLRESQPLLGKTVKTFSALRAVSGSIGTTRSFNANGQIVVLVTFTDATTAIVRIDLE